jgi:hypothetical protein
MILPTFEEVATRDKLRTGLHLALAEARMVMELMQKKQSPRKLEEIKKLVNVERELDYLESTLFELNSEDGS